ncbi:MAG: LytR/AlgR family response regulator transcription factor [Gemmatimonas sp.]|nr:LytTR family DNA-binding domain-containing protein [Gemmatimonadaceae bacterium]
MTTGRDPLRVMIVDDEAHAREGLRLRLRREPDVLVIGEFGDADAALRAMASDSPDVLFLDIEMPGTNGFAMLERAREGSLPVVIFVTAYDQHAVHAFDARALDYLLKPVEQERLRESLARARAQLASARNGEFVERIRSLSRELGPVATTRAGATPPRAGKGLERIPVTVDGATHFLAAKDIDYIAAAGDTVVAHVGTASHVIRKSMNEMLASLDASRFARVHRSTIVNLNRVVRVEPYLHGEYILVMPGGAKLKVSRGYREVVAERLGLGAG